MRYFIASLVLLSVCACAPKVAVDIYKCPVLSDDPGIEVKEITIACPKGEKPKRGGCTSVGGGSIDAKKVDTELCQ